MGDLSSGPGGSALSGIFSGNPATAVVRRGPPTVAITSGKGGVGKTNIVANLAATLVSSGRRVLVIDGNLGLANLDVLLDVKPRYTFADFFYGTASLAQIVTTTSHGILLLPAASGVQALTMLRNEQKIALIAELERLADRVDIVLIDTASGISDAVTYFATAAQHIVVVVTPEPLAMTDGYALIKVLASVYCEKHFRILVNNASCEEQAWRIFDVLSRTAVRYLNVSLDLLGWIPGDGRITQSMARARIVVAETPGAPSARALVRIGERLAASLETENRVKGNLQFFFQRNLEAARGNT